MLNPARLNAEWLEADGLGGFASGTVSGVRTRRYHALLLTATKPPGGRMVLVNGFEAWVETPNGRYALSSQFYDPGVRHPNGADCIESFSVDPWPTWEFRVEDGTRVRQEICVAHESSRAAVTWTLVDPSDGVRLHVRPLLSGRDYHALHHENPAFRFDAAVVEDRVVWQPYAGLPSIVVHHTGTYEQAPEWYRNFLYTAERERGLDCCEDLASPGIFRFDLGAKSATWILEATSRTGMAARSRTAATTVLKRLRDGERKRRRALPTRLERAAGAYVVKRGNGKTIVAGYPWFTDWGRDTFIALRGLCLATGRHDDAYDILVQWAGAVSQGMLPNRFADAGDTVEFNAVDASLWYVVAVYEFFVARRQANLPVAAGDVRALRTAITAILSGYSAGTRYGIAMDSDGLLRCGEPGVQLTWMDAKVGDWVVTPRIGKPVEVQALWVNALRIGAGLKQWDLWDQGDEGDGRERQWADLAEQATRSFRERFWNPQRRMLFDVVDADHQPGKTDAACRPNQIFAVGGLPFSLLDGEVAAAVVEIVEKKLLTSIGLRSLASDEPGYCPRYRGGVRERDAAYHQGTVWPWLLGAFVEAWVSVRGNTSAAKAEARSRFLEPLLGHLDTAGLGHLPEVADGEPPHTPGGCPFQAWSAGEALRLDRLVLA